MTDVEAKLLPEPPLVVLPSLAAKIGLNEAILLQQIYYETRESELTWWPAEAGELRKKFPFWSASTVKRTLASLQRSKYVKVRQQGTDRTKRYRVQIDTMQRLNLAPNRSAAWAQSEPMSSLSRKRNSNDRREDARGARGSSSRRFSRFDEAEQR